MRILLPFRSRNAAPAFDDGLSVIEVMDAIEAAPPVLPVTGLTHAAQFIADMHRTDGLPLFRTVVGQHGFCGLHLPAADERPSVLDADFDAAIKAIRAQTATARAEVYTRARAR